MSSSTNAELTSSDQDPFTVNELADLVLRSSDGHEFYVIKALLSFTSPVFKNMFSLPNPNPLSENEKDKALHLPVVDVSESSIVIDPILRFIYPVDDPRLTLELAFDVLLTAEKYEMHRAAQWAKNIFRTLCLDDKPDKSVIRIYLLSCDRHRQDETRYAARGSLKICLWDPISTRSLSSAPTRVVLNLIHYHNEVTNRLAKLFSRPGFSEWPSDVGRTIMCPTVGCSTDRWGHKGRSSMSLYLPSWWSDIERDMTTTTRITSCGPLSMDVIPPKQLEDRISTGCSNCKKRLRTKGVDQLHKALKAKMAEVASEVQFEIPWDLPEQTPLTQHSNNVS